MRKAKEARFRMCGIGAVVAAVTMLGWLLVSIVGTGYTAFYQHYLTIDVELTESVIDPTGARDPDELRKANFRKIIQEAIYDRFPTVTERREKSELFKIVSASGATNQARQMVYNDPTLVGKTLTITVPTSDDVDQLLKGYIDRDAPENRRKISNKQIVWVDALTETGEIKSKFNTTFFTATDSRDPELAGIAGAVVGSLMALFVAFAVSVPVGVGAAVYLEEFAPQNRFTDFVEININNLAAVPSIVFGLLGLAVFLNFFGMPRSAPLVGGLVLALMTLPTIIIATRSALRAVSPSIVDGALSLGASHTQAVFHHKVPLAAPGILTGSIIGIAQALGETAPLLMIGMVAFVTEIPSGLTEPASALPVQIFLWSDSAERAWAERTSAAIIVLLSVLICMNALAIFLRSRLERRW
ncbi:MAG: phosphate transport system permease protein PstA [Hyphococcus sp.]|nr:MAG: phosphate transport system permease protein PstA [Marinicaulis sp.]